MENTDKREKLALELHLLADAIAEDSSVGHFDAVNNELVIESSLGGTSSVKIVIKNFKANLEEEWPEFINEV